MYSRCTSQLVSSSHVPLSSACSRWQRMFSSGAVLQNKRDPWALPTRDLVERRTEGGKVILDVAKAKREPFLKGLFQAKFDKDILAFPEVLNKPQVDELDEKLVSLGYIDEAFSAEPTLESLQTAGVFGLNIPDEYGGLGYTMTETARVLEATASSSHLQTLLWHNFLVQALLQSGSDEQRQRLLPRLAAGQLTATFCCGESTASSDLNSIRCTAHTAADGAGLLISGTKVAVPCARAADLMLVVANSQERDHLGVPHDFLSTLIVEKESTGITYKSCDPSLGWDVCDVEFQDTPVSADNVLGKVGSAHPLLLGVFNHARILYPAQLVGSLRSLVAMTIKHCLHRPMFGRHLTDFGMTKVAVASINRDMYIMESLTYLTAGIVDLTDQPDCMLEAAVCKVTASELAQSIVDRCLRLLGDKGFYRREEVGDTAHRYLVETRAALRFTGSNEVLKLFIALAGLQHALPVYADQVTKMRNPMLYPVDMLKRMVRTVRWRGRSTAHQPLALYACLHPSMQAHADKLEECVHLFADCCVTALERHGADLMNQQPPLTWLAESVADIYCMCAVLARASRSYCIGLRDAETEMVLATSVVQEAFGRITANAAHLDHGPFVSPDASLLKASDVLLQRGRYASAHSLSRTY